MTWQRPKSFKLVRDEDGTAAIEFALVSVPFFMFLFAIAYIAIFAFNYATLQWAVAKASRLPEINSAVTQSEIASAVDSYLSDAGIAGASVTYSVSQNGSVKTANISATYERSYSVPLINTFDIHYTASSSVPLGS